MPPDLVSAPLARLLKRLGSDRSRRAYADDWARYRAWLAAEGIDVLAVKPRHVEEHIIHLQEVGNQRSTCGRALSVIRAVYGILVLDEVVETNPAREVKNPKFDSAPKTPYLNQEQIEKLLALSAETWREQRDHLCVCLLFGLGWRRAEVARMRVEDFANGTVTGIVKGNKPLTVGVPPWLSEKINEWTAYARLESGALLPRSLEDRRPVSGSIIYDIVKTSAERAGLKINPHGLRRSNLTIGGEMGVSLKERQLSVGHASQATTERYDRARDAAKNAPGRVFVDLLPKKEESK